MGAGQPLFDFKNGNYTEVIGRSSGGVNFAGTTTGRVKISDHRIAAVSTVIFGAEHTISNCSVGGTMTIGAGATLCKVHGNILASFGEVVDNSGNATNSVDTAGDFTPTWTGDGANPAIGNGSIFGRYARRGKVVTMTMVLNVGSTTTFGSGVWRFNLPAELANLTAKQRAYGSAVLFDSGTGYRTGVAEILPTESRVQIVSDNGSNYWQQGSPVTLATNDRIQFTLTYEIG